MINDFSNSQVTVSFVVMCNILHTVGRGTEWRESCGLRQTRSKILLSKIRSKILLSKILTKILLPGGCTVRLCVCRFDSSYHQSRSFFSDIAVT